MVRRFTRAVLVERARLALTDPAGEADARVPITESEALDILTAPPLPARSARFEAGRSAAIGRDQGIAERLGISLSGYGMAHCPTHDDRSKSLSWRWTTEGRLLLHCFAGCSWEQITGA